MKDSCEYCGHDMPNEDKKKHRGFFYHARCKAWQKERDQATKENK